MGGGSSAGIYSIFYTGVIVEDSLVQKTTVVVGDGIKVDGTIVANSFVINSVVYERWETGIDIATSGGYGYTYNTTSYGNTKGYGGFYIQNLKNCIGANNTTADFARTSNYTVSITNCASSDATAESFTGTNVRINQTFSFGGSLNGDFHLLFSGIGAKDYGVDLSADPKYPFSTDIDGDTRSSTWDIGAGEYIDTTPPVRSGGSSSGLFPSGTTSGTLSLVTDESATCKYGTTSNTAYASISSTFTTTGSTPHSTSVVTADSRSYTYYIRCTDAAVMKYQKKYGVSPASGYVGHLRGGSWRGGKREEIFQKLTKNSN